MHTLMRFGPCPRLAAAGFLALTLLCGPALAQRSAAAKVGSGEGVLLHQAAAGQPWEVLKEGAAVAPGGLVIGAGNYLDSSNGAVRVEFFGGVGWSTKFPVMEAGITLLPAGEADFAFTVDRGQVHVLNEKKEGPAQVRLATLKGFVDITLKEPGTHLILEKYGRYPAGTRFRADKPSPTPTSPLFARILAVTKGAVSIAHDGKSIELAAPPGPALVEVDDLLGSKPEVVTLEKLPDYLTERPKDPAKTKATFATVRQLLETKSISEAGVALTQTDDEAQRRAGLVLLAAVDDLAHLGEVFATTKYPDLSEFGVLVMRNWLGRSPGQDARLHAGLVKLKSYTPAEAETVIMFLHGFTKEDVATPELYQGLIDYLDHPKLALRVLSHWHLVRLVPEGRSIPYHPHADQEARDKTYKEWRKLLPEGKLPQDLATTPKDK